MEVRSIILTSSDRQRARKSPHLRHVKGEHKEVYVDRTRNRKLLVSVFSQQEAREAILGGARIIDSEDPRSALGNIKPQRIMDISDAVLDAKRVVLMNDANGDSVRCV